jgi:anti-sigma factor RsiW
VVDGELPPQEHAAALESINADPGAALLHAEYRRLKSAVGSLPAVEVPSAAWKSCTRRLDELDRNRKAERFVTRYAWAMSASVFFLILGAGAWNRFTGQHLGASDVTHMASMLSPFERADKPNTTDVGKWLQDRVGRPVPLNTSAVLRLLSAEYGQAGDIPMARLVYADPQGAVTLYIWRGGDPIEDLDPLPGSSLNSGRVLNQNCVAWIQDGVHFVLVGQREVSDLARTADGLRQATVSIRAN